MWVVVKVHAMPVAPMTVRMVVQEPAARGAPMTARVVVRILVKEHVTPRVPMTARAVAPAVAG